MGAIYAAVSGALLALCFPSFGHPAVAWIALVPLLVALDGQASPLRGFSLGLLTGAVHFAVTVSWIPHVMIEYGGLTVPTSWAAYVLLIAYLALFPAAFGVAVVVLHRRFGPRALFYAPMLWVTSELGRIYLFTGFPWELLGYSQTPMLPIAQVASLFGVLGLSALVVLGNAALAYGVLGGDRRRWRPLAGAALVVLGSVGFGTWRLQDDGLNDAGAPLRVAAVQGNVAQREKWNPAFRDSILGNYLALTRTAVEDGAQLIVWPEAATPFAFNRDPVGAAPIRRLARDAGVHLLIGTTHVTLDDEPRYYNAAVMVDDAGEMAGVYRKHHLVPFGEYVPLRRALFFVSPLVETVGDFSAGPGPEVLSMDGHPVGTAICYEIIYPGLVRGFVTQGSRLLTTVTNDAWYGRTSAPYQHFQQASMRAIEQGRFLVRAANTGISGAVDPYGRVLASTPLFESHVITVDVRLLDHRTLYSRIGDLFAYACAAVTVILLAFALRHHQPRYL